MKKGGVFSFAISSLIPKLTNFLYYANKKIDDVISGYSIETNHKMKNISGTNGSRKLKLGTNIVP